MESKPFVTKISTVQPNLQLQSMCNENECTQFLKQVLEVTLFHIPEKSQQLIKRRLLLSCVDADNPIENSACNVS